MYYISLSMHTYIYIYVYIYIYIYIYTYVVYGPETHITASVPMALGLSPAIPEPELAEGVSDNDKKNNIILDLHKLNKKEIILLNPSIKANFIKNIFNIERV